jgi:NAD(P) transhydrogenase subunit alpha
VHEGVTIIGSLNLPATMPYHASQLYAKNISSFAINLLKDGVLNLDMEDQIIRDTLLTRDGQVVHPRVREKLGLSA